MTRALVLSTLSFVLACGSAASQSASMPQCPAAPPAKAAAKAAPVLEGYWTGVLAGKLHTALRLRRAGYTGILDSIDQGVKFQVENVTLDGTTVRFEIPAVKGRFEGKLADDGSHLEGTWVQAAAPVPQPLAFEKGTAPPEIAEPAKKPLDAPIEVNAPIAPMAFRANGHTHLAYELHVTSYARSPITLQRLEILAGTRAIATLEGDALDHASDSGTKIGARSFATLYVWVDSDDVPTALDHRITVKVGDDAITTQAGRVAVRPAKTPIIGPPLHGKFWRAANGPSNGSAHRRALIPVEGRTHIAQRFAIDWVKPGDDGKTYSGDASKNASYHAYGAEALAVGDGVITEVKDGIPENVPGASRAVPITLETIGGNHVIIDLGGGFFAFYAHLEPGSLKVKVGERVKRGQVLGLVGNSGNSTEPHLHFHVTDASSPIVSEGVPYAFDAFELRDGTKTTKQIPLENDVVAFQ